MPHNTGIPLREGHQCRPGGKRLGHPWSFHNPRRCIFWQQAHDVVNAQSLLNSGTPLMRTPKSNANARVWRTAVVSLEGILASTADIFRQHLQAQWRQGACVQGVHRSSSWLCYCVGWLSKLHMGKASSNPASAVCLGPCALRVFHVELQLYPWCNL